MDNQIPEEHMTDPKYGYVVDGMFLFSKWVRENTPQEDHKFKVGDRVVFSVVTTVTDLMRDCDGSPLYGLDMVGHGWDESSMRMATEWESANEEPASDESEAAE